MERGIAAFVICASLIRQFEFAQNVWINDKAFHELGNERDRLGTQDGTLEFKIPKRPIRKRITGIPAFTTVRGSVLLPAWARGAPLPGRPARRPDFVVTPDSPREASDATCIRSSGP